MARRPAYTLIFLGAQRTDRVDLGPGPDFPVLEQFHKSGQGSDDPSERVEASLVSTPKIGAVVWVLWEGASAQVLDMPTGVIKGMERDELAGALGFEAEPLTGVSAAESAIGGVQQKEAAGAVPEFRRFWITQLTTEVRNRLEEVVVRAGAKFAGVSHPGGLPRERWDMKLTPEAPREWRRIEIWDQVTFSLHGTPDGNVDTRILRSTPGSESWAAGLPNDGTVSWMAAGPATHEDASGQRVPDPQRLALWDTLMALNGEGNALQPVKIDFPEDAVPVDWLRAWVAELTSQKRVPTVEPPSRVSPYRKYYVWGSTAAAMIFAGCMTHYMILNEQATRARTRADQLEEIRTKLSGPDKSKDEEARIAAETEKLQPTLKELAQREANLTLENERVENLAAKIQDEKARMASLLAVHRPALAALLAVLADSEQNENVREIFVKDVQQEANGDLRLSGLCRQSTLADAFATRLETRLGKSGWKVGAAQKILREDRVAFNFTLALTPAVLFELPAGVAFKKLTQTASLPGSENARTAAGGSHP